MIMMVMIMGMIMTMMTMMMTCDGGGCADVCNGLTLLLKVNKSEARWQLFNLRNFANPPVRKTRVRSDSTEHMQLECPEHQPIRTF